MTGFPIPPNEPERLKELQRLRPEKWGGSAALNQICVIAARLLETPISLVSIVDEKEQVFAGKTGLDADRVSRDVAFCAHTIMTPKPFVVENAELDPRFSGNPLVAGEGGVKSYLAVPLETSPGIRIGALCAVDRKPRGFSKSDVETLIGLGQIAVSIIDSHRMTLEMDDQLANAIALQNEMLPSAERLAHIEAHCPLDVSSYYKARDKIGGDIWGIEVTGPQRCMIYAADFTGHGVAAALNTARFHSFIHMMRQRTQKPGSLLWKLNKRLHEVLPTNQFATMFCATLDFKAQSIEYASAGAPPQLYRRSSNAPFEILSQPSLPLGVLRDTAYESQTAPFLHGGTLALYTDGLIETPKPPHSAFTVESLKDFLDNAPQWQTSSDLRRAVISHLFAKPAAMPDDDVTLIVAKNTGGAVELIADFEI
jgi:sigma-B regulation protein RsbU (phosphoserine phosphatase)